MRIHGTAYQVDFAVLSRIEDGNLVFAQVKGNFIVDENMTVFEVIVLHTSMFSQHYRAYILSVRLTHRNFSVLTTCTTPFHSVFAKFVSIISSVVLERWLTKLKVLLVNLLRFSN